MESVRRPAGVIYSFFLILSSSGSPPDLSLSEKIKSVRRPAGAIFFFYIIFFNFELERPPARPVLVRDNGMGASSGRRNRFFF
jgi:hypothetical protein